MFVSFLILLNKTLTFLVRLRGWSGSVFAGRIIKKLDKNILTKIKYPKYVIGVTGSSGKGTTVAILNEILSKEGYKVVWNSSGSNVDVAIITLVLNNTKIFSHKVDADVLLVELDESYIKHSFKTSTLTHLLVTNITRDQPARNAEPEIIFKKILNSIDNKTKVLINVDDPILNRFKYEFDGEVTTFGIDKTKYSLKSPISNNLDAVYCPLCNEKLIYEFYHYGHIGKYKCPKKGCKFQYDAKYLAYDVNLDKNYFYINKHKINMNQNLFYNVYAMLGAYSILKEINIDENIIINNLNNLNKNEKRLKYFSLNKRKIHLLDTKNENNLSYYQTIQYINEFKDNKTIILGFENVSRRYKHNDISLLYDIDYEALNMNKIDKVFIIGRFKYNIMTRLLLANIKEDKLILIEDFNNMKEDIIKKSNGEIFVIADFEMTNVLKNIFEEEEND